MLLLFVVGWAMKWKSETGALAHGMLRKWENKD